MCPMKKAAALLLCFYIFSSFIYGASTNVRLNSIGFLPNNAKHATISGACSAFTVVNEVNGMTVFSGTASGPYSDTGTGESNLYTADFSAVTAPGTYYLNVTGIGTSVNFAIGYDAYNASFIPIFKALYLARCGTAVSETYNGNTFTHPACHTSDANNSKVGGTGTIVPSESGWHDAGDYNKYTVNAGITLGMLFMAWEQFSAKINLLTYGLPSTAAGYPEFLEEIKWETDWLLTMQRADGAVYDKVSETGFDGFEQPQNDTGTRYFWGYNNVGTVETATFCAMMAMAARNFQPYDATYSTTCLNAATSAYNYLKANPTNTTANLTGCTTGDYSSSDPNEARAWAAVEMWVTTGTVAYLTDAETRISSYAPAYVDTDFDWADDKNLAMYSYVMATGSGRNATLLANVQNDIVSTANAIVTAGNNSPYGRPLGTNFYWGCNGGAARQSMMLQIANQISPNVNYLNTSLDILGYLLGRNTQDRSYVTQIGINPPMNPHHRPSQSDGITNPYPGYLVGGSPGNNQQDPVLTLTPSGLPEADYWADSVWSYSSNEVAINWQGAIIYAMSAFLGLAQTPTNTPTYTYTATPTFTVTGTRTDTATFTITFTPTYTYTTLPTFTPTGTPTFTQTYSYTATSTFFGTPTFTSTQSFTATKTYTATVTQTSSASPTITVSSTGTPPTVTFTPSVTVTLTFTPTFTDTVTALPTVTYTKTPVNTSTFTPTSSATYTRTAVSTATAIIFTPTFTVTTQPSATITVTVEEPGATPTQTPVAEELLWPCPANPQTQDINVAFNLTAGASDVSFRVYTMAYRLIRVVDLGGYPAGVQEGKIDKSYLVDLSNGIYFYSIEAALIDGTTQRSRIKEFILLK